MTMLTSTDFEKKNTSLPKEANMKKSRLDPKMLQTLNQAYQHVFACAGVLLMRLNATLHTFATLKCFSLNSV